MTKYCVVPQTSLSEIVTPAYTKLGIGGAALESCLQMGHNGWAYGVPTHGHNVILINHGPFGVDAGLINPQQEEYEVRWRRPAVQYWDGKGMPGPHIANLAIDAAIEMAKTFGIGMVQVSNAGHVGCPGVLARDIADIGLVGRIVTRGGRVECMAPGGQDHPRASTDTISIGIPTEAILGFSLVLDFTLARMAMGKVRKAVIEKRQLPKGVAFDRNGTPTMEPSEVFPNGAVSYIGDAKGYGYAALIEIIGAFFGFQKPSVVSHQNTVPDPKPDVRSVSFEIEIMEVPQLPETQSRVEELIQYLFSGSETLRIPGQRRHEFNEACVNHGGILLDPAVVEWLQSPAMASVIDFNPAVFEMVELDL